MSPGIYHDIPHADYHRGLRNPKPLSSTLAKALITKSPLEARWEQENRVIKTAYDEGQAVHELVLEGGLKTIQPIDLPDKRGNAWKGAKADAEEYGFTPMLERDLAPLRDIAASVLAHPEAAELFAKGDPEVSALTETDGIWEQARADWLRIDGARPVIADLKTVAGSANPRDFNRTIASYHYHLQAAMYVDVFRRALGIKPLFVWVVVSKKPPYAVSVIQASQSTLDTGHLLYGHAFGIYAECVRSGHWPGYAGVTDSSLPIWAEYEADEITGRDTNAEILL